MKDETTKPEALRLADELAAYNKFLWTKGHLHAQCISDGAAELRRQHAEIERLKRVEAAAKWFVNNQDSPNSAAEHIKTALENIDAAKEARNG